MVRRIGHLQVLANTNLELPDVVGEIRSVQGSDLENNADTSRIVVLLLIEPAVTVYVSLRDDAASSFRGFLKVADRSQSVMLVTSVSPKLFGGNLYLNSTQGTRFFFDTSLPEIAEFVSRSNELSGKKAGDRENTEQFLTSMIGDDCELSMAVVRDVVNVATMSTW